MFNKKINRGYKWNKMTVPIKAAVTWALFSESDAVSDLRGRRVAYIKERARQKERLDSQTAHLEKLFKENSITENVYEREKTLLAICYEQKRDETREKFGFKNQKLQFGLKEKIC